jgi:hypothetical protein
LHIASRSYKIDLTATSESRPRFDSKAQRVSNSREKLIGEISGAHQFDYALQQ